jgi:serine/threonine protein kinase
VGTLEYLPPEYAQGVDSGPARDIWAVGILAFEMAIGKHPFEGLKENEKWAKLVNVSRKIARILRLSISKSLKRQKKDWRSTCRR